MGNIPNQITIRDAYTGNHVTGKLVRYCSNGVLIEDQREIRWFAFDRNIINDPLRAARIASAENGELW